MRTRSWGDVFLAGGINIITIDLYMKRELACTDLDIGQETFHSANILLSCKT